MTATMLKMNMEKTNLLISGSKHNVSLRPNLVLHVGTFVVVEPTKLARNCIMMDADGSMTSQVR